MGPQLAALRRSVRSIFAAPSSHSFAAAVVRPRSATRHGPSTNDDDARTGRASSSRAALPPSPSLLRTRDGRASASSPLPPPSRRLSLHRPLRQLATVAPQPALFLSRASIDGKAKGKAKKKKKKKKKKRRRATRAEKMDAEMRELQREIKDLEAKFERSEKVASSEAAAAHLPELSEADLTEIYEALSAPPDPTDADRRLARLSPVAKKWLGSISDGRQDTSRRISAASDVSMVQNGGGGASEEGKKEAVSVSGDQARIGSTNQPARAVGGAPLPSPVGAASEMRPGERPELDSAIHHHIVLHHLNSAGGASAAIAHLQALESTSTPASLATYTVVLSHLLRPERSSEEHALAWDLFAHMRLAAHPVPDEPAYAAMILACAKGFSPASGPSLPAMPFYRPFTASNADWRRSRTEADAERALDLFHEMTTHYSIRPTSASFNAVILACAKRRSHYYAAFQLLREMLELDKRGREAAQRFVFQADARSETLDDDALARRFEAYRFRPDRYTFNALLQGCAKMGDLPRARWILAEMIRVSPSILASKGDGGDSGAGNSGAHLHADQTVKPNEETMVEVFFAYGSYRPPLVGRGAVARNDGVSGNVKVDAQEGETNLQRSEDPVAQDNGVHTEDRTSATEGDALGVSEINRRQFTPRTPQTPFEVVQEARALFYRILHDRPVENSTASEAPFSDVALTPRLLNAFLSVLASHGRFDEFLDASDSLFAKLGVEKDGYTYGLVLKTCSQRGAADNERAREVGERHWADWRAFAAHRGCVGFHGEPGRAGHERRAWEEVGLGDRQVERCWADMISLRAKHHDLAGALDLVREFVSLYPPSSLTSSFPTTYPDPSSSAKVAPNVYPSPSKSPKTKMVRLTPSSALADLSIPPHLTFPMVELLFHRCNAAEDDVGIRYLTWVTNAYEGWLRKRERLKRGIRLEMDMKGTGQGRRREAGDDRKQELSSR